MFLVVALISIEFAVLTAQIQEQNVNAEDAKVFAKVRGGNLFACLCEILCALCVSKTTYQKLLG